MATHGTARATTSARRVGRSDVEAVRKMASIFSRLDQQRGGGHARSVVVQYLTSEVATYLRGSYLDRALGAAGQNSAAAQALITAEDDLACASAGDDEPSRVFFFGEASLAHETACTLRDTGDLSGALTQFHRSVRTRKATTFTRTHVVTLGYLAAVRARRGEIDQACSIWSTALEAIDGIHSARARQTVIDMRAALSEFRHRGIPAAVELDVRACAYLNTESA